MPDVIDVKGMEWQERGAGNSTILFELGDVTMGSHVYQHLKSDITRKPIATVPALM